MTAPAVDQTAQSQPVHGQPVQGQPAAVARRIAIGAAVLALLLAAMDATVMGTVLPTVVRDLKGGAGGGYAWLVSAFMLAQVAGTPVAGWVSDRVSDRALGVWAAVAFLAASALAGSAHSFTVLVAARLLHGLAAGALVVSSYVIVGRAFGPQRRAKAQALLSMVWGVAGVLGPVMGAAVTQAWGWRWVFLLNIPLCVAVIAVVAATASGRAQGRAQAGAQGRETSRFPGGEYLVIIAGTTLLLIGVQGPVLAIGGAGGAVIAAAGIAILALTRWRGGSLVPREVLTRGPSAAAALATFGACVAMYATVTVLPLHLARLGMSTAGIAVVVGVSALGWVVGSGLTGGVLNKRGYRLPVACGGVALVASCAVSATGEVPWLAGVLVGLGTGAVTAATLALLQDQSPPQRLGIATSAATMVRNMGAAVGVNGIAALSAVAGASSHRADNAFWVLAAIVAVAVLLPALRMPRERGIGS
jgi:MFS family permease